MLYNDAFIPLLGGQKHPQALGQSTRDVWAEQWDEIIGPLMQRVVQFVSPVSGDDQSFILERNGYPEECYFTFSYSPILGVDRKVGGVFNIVTETTAKVMAERRLRLVRNLGLVSATQGSSMAQTCLALLDVLASTRQSLPFAVALLSDSPDVLPRGVGAYGLAADAWSLGMSIDDYAEEGELILRVMRSGQPEMLTGLRERYSWAILPGPIGPLIPDEAMVVPLSVARGGEAAGVLVLGISPYRRMDDEYRSFLALVAAQVGIALTDTNAYQQERSRVQVLAELDWSRWSSSRRLPRATDSADPVAGAAARCAGDAGDAVRRPSTASNCGPPFRLRSGCGAWWTRCWTSPGAEARTWPGPAADRCGRSDRGKASMFRSTAEHAGLRFDVDSRCAGDRGGRSRHVVDHRHQPAVQRGEIHRTTAVPSVELTRSATRHGCRAHRDRHRDRASTRRSRPGFSTGSTGRTRTTPSGAGIGLALVADLVRGLRRSVVDLRHHGSTMSTSPARAAPSLSDVRRPAAG